MRNVRIDPSERNCWKPPQRALRDQDDEDVVGAGKASTQSPAISEITHSILAVRLNNLRWFKTSHKCFLYYF